MRCSSSKGQVRAFANGQLDKEIIMKNFVLFIALVGALTLSTSLTSPVSNAANAPKKERGVMQFNQPVTLMGVRLKGEYLFVHDDAAMARGEACTYVYEGQAALTNKLVASFHCRPVIRARADSFIVRTVLTPTGYELKEYQFAGGVEAHRVPVNPHEGHVAITGLGN
jgi:hypothetical protein